MKFTIALNTFKEAIRQRLILLVALIALALVVMSRYFLSLDLGHEQLRFIFDFSSGALNFFGTIIAVVATCSLFVSEVENKTIITLISKSVNFGDFVFGKLGGIFMTLGVFVAVIFVASAFTLVLVEMSLPSIADTSKSSVNLVGLFWYCTIQWLKLCMCASVAALMCGLSKSFLFSTAVSFMCVIAATMANTVAELGANSSISDKVVKFILPDLQILNTSESFVFGLSNASMIFNLGAYSLVYIICCALFTVWCFSRRDF